MGDKGKAWSDFIAASDRLDDIYNGIVYRPHDILDSTKFHVDDRVFSDICQHLARSDSPYDFNFIPIHILGSIYERFLGKVIVATNKRATVEEKPEVRKAGGVYYTPEYIVRHIVENTVGKLIAGKTPNQIAKMRFADIACGSGSFLLGIFDLLLIYHGQYYNKNPRKARKGDCIKRDGKLYLTLQKKREILLNNIYGVDIDAQAVEVCQLSLYLKLLQEETEASTRQYLLDFEHIAQMKKLLPDLSKNIVCGNSLIGRDGERDLVDDEVRELNAMDFEDAFPAVMKRGGFDAIVGNPPYIFTRNEGLTQNEKAYFYRHYKHQSAQLNTFGLFLERSHAIMRQGASLGYITPNNWLTIDSCAPLRSFLLQNTADITVVNILDRVFAAANVDTAIVHLRKGKATKVRLSEMKDGHIVFSRAAELTIFKPPQFILQISLVKDERIQKILGKIESASKPLSEFCRVSTGLKAYQTGKGKPCQTDKQKKGRIFHARMKANKTYGRYLAGEDVCRYHLSWSGAWLSYGEWLAEPRRSVPFAGERILVRQIPASPPYVVHGVYIDENYYNDINSMIIFAPRNAVSLKFLLGMINSRVLSMWFQKTYDKLQRKIFPQFKVNELARFPIPPMKLTIPADKARHDEMVTKVEAMLEAKKQLAKAQTDKDKSYYENRCAALDRQIDRLVYELYDLTEDEIQIVEESQEKR
ncbi:MAG: N-6 DNA methylase [candidate division Zixibacteria bacterium]|nr:N-6 DNA methylase [candidate division Zixibacteria bacterium]